MCVFWGLGTIGVSNKNFEDVTLGFGSVEFMTFLIRVFKTTGIITIHGKCIALKRRRFLLREWKKLSPKSYPIRFLVISSKRKLQESRKQKQILIPPRISYNMIGGQIKAFVHTFGKPL